MAEQFVYISRNQLTMKDGLRHAQMGEIPEPVVYGVQGALKEYYKVPPETPALASTLDHIISAVGG